jgi:hypothetical protein
MKKALCWSVSMCAVAGSLALAVPGTATAGSRPGVMALGPAFGGRLYGVSTPDSHNVFAAGLNDSGSLIVHWNGSRWSQFNPHVGFLIGVAGSGPRDQWAVGGTDWFPPTNTMAWHWNGSSWRRVATPNPAGGGFLNAVAATSPSNAWAVGQTGPGPGVPSPTAPLIEHWNGRHWTIQHIALPAGGGLFTGVTMLSPSNAWAVGWTGGNSESTGQTTLIEHWNGKTWTRVPSPNEGTASFLHAITAKSSDNAWAVGSYFAADGTERTLALHWDGSHWTVVPSQSPGDEDAFISVTAAWTNNIWAVGYRTNCADSSIQCKTLVEHWNGSRWTLLASPNPPSGYLNILLGVRAASRTSIWAVGSTDFESTLIMHWNGTAWS